MECVAKTNKRMARVLNLKPWIVCISAALLFFYEFIQGTMFASIAPHIMHDFNIQADKMVYLSSVYYLANVIFLLFAGVLLDRFSAKTMLLLAMFFCVLSSFVLSGTHDFMIAFLCRFVIGIGSAFCFLGPIRIATRWFPPQKMAFVTGVVVTLAMFGGMLAQYPLMTLVTHIGWRQAVVQVSLLGAVMWVFMWRFIEDQPKDYQMPQSEPMNVIQIMKRAYGNWETFLSGVYASLMNMGVAVFGAVMGQLYLVQRLNISQTDAAMVNGMLFFGAMLGGPVMGWWSDKLMKRIFPMKVGAVCAILVSLCILYLPVHQFGMAVLFFLLGFITSSQVISFPFVAEKSEPILIASSISLVSVVLQGGYVVYQNLYGWILTFDHAMRVVDGSPVYSLQAYQWATMMLPVSFGIAYLALMGLRESRTEHAA